MEITDQTLTFNSGQPQPTLDYVGEEVNLLDLLAFSYGCGFRHIIPEQDLESTLTLTQDVIESGIVHDTTPEESLLDDLDFIYSLNFEIEYTLSHTLDFISLGGIGYSETLSATLTITQTVEEGYVYPPSEINLTQTVSEECGPGPAVSLSLSHSVGLTFSKTDTLSANMSLTSYGVAVLLRDGHEYTYDIKGSGDA